MGEIRRTLKEAQDGVAVALDESTTIVVVPAVSQVTLEGRAFDGGGTFLLPRAIHALNEVFAFATRLQAKHAVVIGHVEDVDANPDALSQARATIAQSWLMGDTAPWLEQYGTGVAQGQRWGAREDKYLLTVALSGIASPPPKPDETGDPRVRAFQTIAGIKVDGIAGPVTRGKLVEKYFAASRAAQLNGAPPPKNGITLLDTKVVAHAAGANFTLQQVSDAKKSTADEPQDDPDETSPAVGAEVASQTATQTTSESKTPESQARIDFMFFFPDAGPDPAPGAPDGPEFLEWVKQTDLQRSAVVGASEGANQLFIELWDKDWFTRHKGAKYTLQGPEIFSGTTNGQGRIEHDDVLPGDYTLTLTLEFFSGEDKVTDEYKASVVVHGDNEPQVRALGAVPRCELAQLRGLLFDTNKSFLVPEAVTALQDIRAIYDRHNGAELLVVGHTDTMGTPSVNDPLSLERAKATLAYVQDDVDTWLSFYGSSIPVERRWGKAEDARMQELVNDPSLGRKQLIAAYMSLDGAELDDETFHINGTAHGCGENFPLDETATELDSAPGDNKDDALDRRVELFFFNPAFGIVPKPPGENSKKGSKQYHEWRKLAQAVREGVVPGAKRQVQRVEVESALFRLESAVVMPEGENPSSKEHAALTSVGAFATILRFNEAKDPKRKLLVAGHTDTSGDGDSNQELSIARAKCALAVLTGDRASFVAIAEERHKVSDYKQILSWATRAFAFFTCDPGKINDDEFSGITPLKAFQAQYNAAKVTLEVKGDDVDVDGSIGEQTWGAIFDVYEFALRDELGVDIDGLKQLRDVLEFVDDERKALGFGEHHPVDGSGDGVRSQANRRVELLLFDPGQQPDLGAAETDPAASEIYDTDKYEFEPIRPRTTNKVSPIKLSLGNFHNLRLKNAQFSLETDTGVVVSSTTNDTGVLEANVPRDARSVKLKVQAPDPGHPEQGSFEADLKLSTLAPRNTARGTLQRLRLLGLWDGPDLAVLGERGGAALSHFQLLVGLPLTGQLDANTADALDKLCREPEDRS